MQLERLHIAKIDARFMAMLTLRNAHQNTLARLGELKVHTISSLTTLADTRTALRACSFSRDTAMGTPSAFAAALIALAAKGAPLENQAPSFI